MSRLLILGAGQHGHVVKEIAEELNCYNQIDFLDDNSKEAIGKISDYIEKSIGYDELFVAIGNNKLRIELIEKIKKAKMKIATIIHPKSIISKSAIVRPGTVVEAGAIINTNTYIDEGCIISLGAIIDHDTKINKGCHIRPGVIVPSNQIIETLTEINVK